MSISKNVDIIDVINIVHSILNEFQIEPVYMWTADMDFNLELNVNDVIKLVTFIFLP